MSNINTVKNNMFQSYQNCSKLENDLNQLINILNTIREENCFLVSDYISSMEMTIQTTYDNFKKMLSVNRNELHILFSEFNRSNEDMNSKIEKLKTDLKELDILATELYTLYKLSESMEFFLEYLLSEDDLKKFIPSINQFKNDLLIFKMSIDQNNNKLKVGVRN